MTDGRFTATEGLVQAAVSVYKGDSARVMLDREVGPYFINTRAKSTVQKLYSDPLEAAVSKASAAPGKPRTPFGMKCDVLALDADGHLVALEVKPGSVPTLAWVAAQATMYARVLQHWIDHDPQWAQIITDVFRQREKLGLIPDGFTRPSLKRKVVPAVAFQRIASDKYIERMLAVQEALLRTPAGDPGLKFYEVSLPGRLDEHKPS